MPSHFTLPLCTYLPQIPSTLQIDMVLVLHVYSFILVPLVLVTICIFLILFSVDLSPYVRTFVTCDISNSTGKILTKLGWMMRLPIGIWHVQNYTGWSDSGAMTSDWKCYIWNWNFPHPVWRKVMKFGAAFIVVVYCCLALFNSASLGKARKQAFHGQVYTRCIWCIWQTKWDFDQMFLSLSFINTYMMCTYAHTGRVNMHWSRQLT